MKAMTSQEAIERFRCQQCEVEGDGACEWNCVLSSTCSLLCRKCRRAAYMQGSYNTNPKDWECPHCGAVIKNEGGF